jgi:hypothetical protein
MNMSENLNEIYQRLCNTPSDINEHLPILAKYAKECSHITEMGVRHIVSTYALLMGMPKKMTSYDINPCNWEPVRDLVKDNTDFSFIIGNTLEIQIEPTELLFIDTLHNYTQLKKELELHSNKVSKYIIFHDTSSFEIFGESYSGKSEKGIWQAIQEFMNSNSNWVINERFTNNNGLTIIKKTS